MINLTVPPFVRHRLSTLVPWGISAGGLLGAIALQIYAPGGLRATTPTAVEPEDEPTAVQLQLLKTMPTFGFENLLADWTWLNFLQYFGDEANRKRFGYELNENYFDAITALDPRWLDIYVFLSTAVSFYQGNPETAIQFMERGTTALFPGQPPEAWLIWRLKAIDQLLLAGDTPGAIQSLEMAANWAENTTYQDFAPQFRQAAQTLKENPDNPLVRINAWLSVYSQVTDQRVQERALQELLKLGVKPQVGADGQTTFVIPPGLE